MSVKRVEVAVRSKRNSLPLPLQSCDSWMFMKENRDRKKKSDSADLSFQYKHKSDFHKLWQQHRQLKTMEMNKGGLNWYFRWGIYTSIPTWIHLQNQLEAAEALSLKISSHRTCLKWSQRLPQSAQEVKLCNETRHPVVTIMESQ